MAKMKRLISVFLAALCIYVCLAAALPASAQAQELGYSPITKVLATTTATPVASQNALEIGGATSTSGCYFTGISWYDSAGQFIDGAFTTDYATVNIRLDAAPGYYFAEGMEAYLNNSAVEYTIYDGGNYVILSRTYAPDVWAPTIIKHPGGETVDEGGWCSFVATASSADASSWTLVDASGKSYTMEQLAAAYPGLTYSESMGKIVIHNIPSALDGSKIYCTFSGSGGKKDTNAASLKVKYDKPSPSPSPTPSPTPSPSPSPAASGADASGDAHEHSFSRAWKHDADKHWHECECGERSDEAAHVMSWTETRAATKKQPGEESGECGVCDYTATREVEYEKPASSGRWILYAGIGVAALVVVLMLLSAARQKRAARRRAQARRRRYYDEQ